jgi:hypothetical protein
VEVVAVEVANLRVHDNNNATTNIDMVNANVGDGLVTNPIAITTTTANMAAIELAGSDNGTTKEAEKETAPPCINAGNTVAGHTSGKAVIQVLDSNNEPVPTAVQVAPSAVHVPIFNNEPVPGADQVGGVAVVASDGEGSDSTPTNMKTKGTKTWKRNMSDKGNDKAGSIAETPPHTLVYQRKKVRQREEGDDLEEERNQLVKRGTFLVPSLEQCLGAEVVNELRRAETEREALQEEGKIEVAGLEEAGSLSGATDSTRQEP